MSLPRSGEIRKALKATFREVKLSLKEVNQRAAKLMERGHYERAKSLMAQGQEIHTFLAEIQALQKRVADLRDGGSDGKLGKGERHALWEYYQPILKSLISLGGEATRAQIEAKLVELFGNWLQLGDEARMARGRPRWQVMIARAKKPMLKEGFVEAPNMMKWRITESGRKAAGRSLERSHKS